ncbi:hypothetical protein ACET3Z_010099 [Daucus carota]
MTKGSGSGMTTILFLKDIGPVGQNRVNVQFILLGEGLHKILNTRHPLQRWLMKLAQFYCSFGENSVTPLNEAEVHSTLTNLQSFRHITFEEMEASSIEGGLSQNEANLTLKRDLRSGQ